MTDAIREASMNGEIRKAISANALLSLLEPSEQKALAAVAHLQRFAKGQTIYEEGKPATDIWVVASGQVKIVKFSEGGQALALELMIAPELFGAVFYARDPVYPCSAIALQEAVVLRFRMADLFSCSKKNSRLQNAMLAETCRRFCHAQNMRGLAMEKASKRIAYVIVYLHQKFGSEILHSRATLAELAGTTLETAIRITSLLNKRGIIETKRGSIEVLSLGMLEEFAFSISAKNRPAIVARQKS